MTAYLDSSALIKLYVKEEKSETVAKYVRALAAPLPFSQLHDLELKNALRLKLFRKEATRKRVEASIRLVDQDLTDGVLQRPALSWIDVFGRAQELSGEYSSQIGCRSLDLLHVASATLLDLTDFMTFDDRQGILAFKVGLQPVEI